MSDGPAVGRPPAQGRSRTRRPERSGGDSPQASAARAARSPAGRFSNADNVLNATRTIVAVELTANVRNVPTLVNPPFTPVAASPQTFRAADEYASRAAWPPPP